MVREEADGDAEALGVVEDAGVGCDVSGVRALGMGGGGIAEDGVEARLPVGGGQYRAENMPTVRMDMCVYVCKRWCAGE